MEAAKKGNGLIDLKALGLEGDAADIASQVEQAEKELKEMEILWE
jgi:hypothetical protein